ncbi:MAG: hypothetical protein IPK57_16495 [Chitinophagaceae bacterium]|nr:hypothetical protein [Chitinophagaceae bacterium]
MVTHKSGRLLAQTHYYPFGLTMAHPVSLAFGNQNYKYNGKRNRNRSGAAWRLTGEEYDEQIGRWHVIDPLCEKYVDLSLYNYVANNPLSNRSKWNEIAWKGLL